MALETFNELCEITSPIKYTDSLRSVQFGDGYEQVADNGINSTIDEISLKCSGTNAQMLLVEAFMHAHKVKAFAFKPPAHPLGLYRVVKDSVTFDPESTIYATVTFTLRRAYGVFA